jgi:glutathione synthase/RimK-type ligase-like ATP-grasp enzyme
LLRNAARERRLAVEVHDPATVTSPARVPPGDLLFCPAASAAAGSLERRLWQPGVVTFHTQPLGPFAEIVDPLTLFSTLGLPVPRSERLPWVDAGQVAGALERLGGLPIVVKLGGAEGGAGVMRLDTFTSLLTVLEGFALRRESPLLQAHVADAEHWRLVVVGERVVASYRNPLREDGFRSQVSRDPADYAASPPPGAEALALAAARGIQVALAGVDVLVHPSGRLYLLEANFPCYYPLAQRVAGIDVAGAMVDWLLARAAAEQHRG